MSSHSKGWGYEKKKKANKNHIGKLIRQNIKLSLLFLGLNLNHRSRTAFCGNEIVEVIK